MKQINTIKGYEEIRDWYFVTSCGRAISIRDGEIKVLKTRVNKGGYEQITFSNIEGWIKTCYIHRLVALAYIPNPENKPQVNHIDEVKTHNYVGNLEWVTMEENINYGTRNKKASESMKGREVTEEAKKKMSESRKGEKNHMFGKNHTEETKQKISKAKKGKYVGDENHMFGKKGEAHPSSKPKEYYETHPVVRGSFKITCKNQNWEFDDFYEIDSGEKCGYNKKYFYIQKIKM